MDTNRIMWPELKKVCPTLVKYIAVPMTDIVVEKQL